MVRRLALVALVAAGVALGARRPVRRPERGGREPGAGGRRGARATSRPRRRSRLPWRSSATPCSHTWMSCSTRPGSTPSPSASPPSFAPFAIVGPPRRLRRDAGDTVYLRRTFALRCLSATCVPSGESARYEFPPARIRFTEAGVEAAETSADVVTTPMPFVRVYSRFTAIGRRNRPRICALGGRPPLPAGSVVPDRPGAPRRLAPRRRSARRAGRCLPRISGLASARAAGRSRSPSPSSRPPPPLSPLEQALILLEQSIRVDGAADQRRALELVAEELELADWGDRDLARTARALAWSEGVPPANETTRLAARVRTALPPRRKSARS